MGLDNGIFMKRKDGGRVDYPKCVHDFFDYDKNELDLAYWRKCWGLRSDFLRKIDCHEGNDSETLLTVDDLRYMRRYILNYMIHPTDWKNDVTYGYSDFNGYVIFNGLKMIGNLTWAIKELKRNNEVEVYFYDSY